MNLPDDHSHSVCAPEEETANVGLLLLVHGDPDSPTASNEITDWDSWLRAYQNSVSAEKETGPQFENLRKIFFNERNALFDLFKPINQHVEQKLKEDTGNRGMRLYGEWGRTKRKEMLLSYYDNEFFRAQYARNRFLNSARSFMQALALRILPHSAAVEEYLPHIRRVVSIGVGPGSDIAGLLACLRTRGMNQKITYFALDQCPLWEEYIRVCDRGWSSKYNVSIWFKFARIGSVESIEFLPEADMIVFSFSNTALMDAAIWPILRQRYRLIIVLDGIKEILIDGFSDCHFEKYQLNEKTNLYFTFRSFEEDMEMHHLS